jgi:hypothetical protein
MKKVRSTFVVLALFAGCATQRVATPGQDYRGEVWTWDAQRATVTLLQGTQAVRVRVTPDQMKGLRMHEITTIHGVAEGPVPLEQVTIPGPAAFVGRAPAQEIDVNGTVAAVDSRGMMTIDAGGQRVQAWTAQPGASQFKIGDSVRAHITVQPGTVVSGTASGAPARSEPGDYAVFVAPVTAADSAGALTLDTPRGPMVLPMPPGAGSWVGEVVEVRSEVHPAR